MQKIATKLTARVAEFVNELAQFKGSFYSGRFKV